jgi:hypothetical protein
VRPAGVVGVAKVVRAVVAPGRVAADGVAAVGVAVVCDMRLGGREAVLTASGGLAPQGLHEMALSASGSEGT